MRPNLDRTQAVAVPAGLRPGPPGVLCEQYVSNRRHSAYAGVPWGTSNKPPPSREKTHSGERWITPVAGWDFTRNEGVPGSSPGVGFSLVCREFFDVGNAGSRRSGTKRVHLWAHSQLMKWSPFEGESGQFAGSLRREVESRWFTELPGSAREVTRVPALPSVL